MILRFMTKRTGNGWRRYLALDTEKKVFTRDCPRMIMDGEEITTKALRNIQAACENDGWKEVDGF